MKATIYKTIKAALYHCGIIKPYLKYKCKNSAMILAYHRVETSKNMAESSLMPGMYVSTESLEMQIKCLKEIFEIVQLEEVVKYVNGERKSDIPLCALTFDDGWKDVYQYGFPILKKYNIPATVFLMGNSLEEYFIDCFNLCFEAVLRIDKFPETVSNNPEIVTAFNLKNADKIEKARLINNRLRKLPICEFIYIYDKLKEIVLSNIDVQDLYSKYSLLSFDEIRKMQNRRITFGYHSKNHYMLDKLNYEQLMDEIQIPRELYERNGIKINGVFCYPDGKYSEIIIKTLKENGYFAATSLIKGLNAPGSNPYLLRRINIHEGSCSTEQDFLSFIAYNLNFEVFHSTTKR